MEAYHRFERTLWTMNAAILSIAFYALGDDRPSRLYGLLFYQDVSLLAASPAILSMILGLAGATHIQEAKKRMVSVPLSRATAFRESQDRL